MLYAIAMGQIINFSHYGDELRIQQYFCACTVNAMWKCKEWLRAFFADKTDVCRFRFTSHQIVFLTVLSMYITDRLIVLCWTGLMSLCTVVIRHRSSPAVNTPRFARHLVILITAVAIILNTTFGVLKHFSGFLKLWPNFICLRLRLQLETLQTWDFNLTSTRDFWRWKMCSLAGTLPFCDLQFSVCGVLVNNLCINYAVFTSIIR